MNDDPHSIEAELILLGTLISDQRSFWHVRELVEAGDFYEKLHSYLFDTIDTMMRKNEAVNIASVTGYMASVPDLPDGFIAHVAASGAGMQVAAPDYARQIADLAARRGLIETAEQIISQARNATPDQKATDIAEAAETALYGAIRGREKGDGLQTMGQVLVQSFDRTAKAYQGETVGVQSGLLAWDRLVGQMHAGDLIAVGGATSAGKSAVAQVVAEGAAKRGHKVAVFSLEMTAVAWVNRLIAQRSGIEAWRLEDGDISKDEFNAALAAGKEIEGLPLHIDGTPRLSPAQIRARAKRLAMMGGLDLFVVDHLTHVRLDRHTNIADRIEDGVASLHDIAKELGVPLVLISHLNRDYTQRNDKRPQLSDFYGGSAIEKDADVAVMIHREEYHLERSQPREGTQEFIEWRDRLKEYAGIGELIKLKGRRRKGVGTERLKWIPEFTLFEDINNQEELL